MFKAKAYEDSKNRLCGGKFTGIIYLLSNSKFYYFGHLITSHIAVLLFLNLFFAQESEYPAYYLP